MLTLMLKRLLALLVLLPPFAQAQALVAPPEPSVVERKMSDWLAHPLEFGVRPKRVSYLRSVRTPLAGSPVPIEVNIVEYEMPDGTHGRGLVGPVTWSFLGPIPYEKLGDVPLVTAYAGWLWIFTALNDGRATSEPSPRDVGPLVEALRAQGVVEVKVQTRYRVRDSEFFEFTGLRGGKPVKGAGSEGSLLVFEATAPQASLPVVYTYLGRLMRGEI